MTALQRISASIKRRRDSILEKSQSELDNEEAQQTLDEAKAFISQAENKNLAAEDVKMLLFLSNMLENSLSIARTEQQLKQATIGRRNSHQRRPSMQQNSCITWAAGGVQSQKQRKLLQMAKLESTNAPDMDTIHEEEHEHSSGTFGIKAMEEGATNVEIPAEALELPCIQEDEGQLILYESPEPLLVVVFPHIALLLTLIFYLISGTLIYRLIDPEIAAKSSARGFIWAFQLLATIGWGDSFATTTFSQSFTVIYILLGIPMLFSAYANFGRFITVFCCYQAPKYWKRLKEFCKGKKRPKVEIENTEVQRLPLVIITLLFCFHLLIGLIIYSFWLKQWPIVSTIYFSVTTFATSGFGDFHPDTDSWMETIIAVLYISLGIVLLSALFLIIALHYQSLHHIQMKEVFSKFYGHYLQWKKRQS